MPFFHFYTTRSYFVTKMFTSQQNQTSVNQKFNHTSHSTSTFICHFVIEEFIPHKAVRSIPTHYTTFLQNLD